MSLRDELKKLDAAHWQNASIKIRPVLTEDDLIYALFDCELTDAQRELVNPAAFSIGRAYLFPESNCPCIICKANEEPIGFLNLSEWSVDGAAYSWSYYIDRRHQGAGYGKSAARLAIHVLKTVNPRKQIKLSTEAENSKAQALYQSLGFVRLDEMDGDDLVFGL